MNKRRKHRKQKHRGMSSTPFDDAFRTLMAGPSELVVPFLNAMFPNRKPIPDDAELVHEKEKFLINRPNGKQAKVETDSCVRYGNRIFHVECQSYSDGTMLIRMFEYDAQVALVHGMVNDGTLDVFFPESGILYLRSGRNGSGEKLRVRIHTSGTDAEYEVKTMNIRNISMEELFEKKLYFLVPFYVLNYEKMFPQYENDSNSRKSFLNMLSELLERLNGTQMLNMISELSYSYVVDVLKRLIEYLTRDYSVVRKEAETVMGGKVWNIKAQNIYDKGRLDEKKKGDQNLEQKTIQVYLNCIACGMSEADAIAISEISDELLKKIKK